MRVLLDESLPRQLAREIVGHEVRTVHEQQWAGLENGELLRLAVSNGFDAFLTADQNLQYQQNLANLGVAVIVLAAKTNRLADLRSLVPEVLRALNETQPGVVVRVGGSTR